MNLKHLLYITVVLISIGLSPLDASFENSDFSGRVVGLGNAYTSISNDVAGLTFNPSGVTFIEEKSLSFSYTKLYLGIGNINNGYLGVSIPIIENFLYCGAYLNSFGEDIYSEKTLGFVFGLKKIMKEDQYLSVGFAIKNMSKGVVSNSFVEANPIFALNREVTGIGFDAGILYRILNTGSVGVAVINLNQPDIHFIDEDKVLMTIKTGISYYFMKELLGTFDFNYSNSNYTANLGGEYKIQNTGLIARVGGELGSLGNKSINVGFGFETINFSIDYGFKFPVGFIDNYGTHVVSLTLRETKPKATEMEESKKMAEVVKAPVALTPAAAPVTVKAKEIVTELKGSNIQAAYDPAITEIVCGIFVAADKFNVLAKEKVDELLNEKMLKLTGCTSIECAVETGRVLSADDVLIGSAKKGNDGTIEIMLKLIDVVTGKVVAADKKYESKTALDEGLPKIVSKISTIKKFQEKKRTIAVLDLEVK